MGLGFATQFDPSQAVWRIDNYTPTTITAQTKPNLPAYLVLESLAQTCGLHARWLFDFKVHIFLVSLAHCICPEGQNTQSWTIQATLKAQTTQALRYSACLNNDSDCTVTLGCQPTPATTAQTNFFRERFQCLTTPLPSAFN